MSERSVAQAGDIVVALRLRTLEMMIQMVTFSIDWIRGRGLLCGRVGGNDKRLKQVWVGHSRGAKWERTSGNKVSRTGMELWGGELTNREEIIMHDRARTGKGHESVPHLLSYLLFVPLLLLMLVMLLLR